MAMDKAEQVQNGGVIQPDPEAQTRNQSANPGVGRKGFFFPTYYNKGGYQGQGKG